MILSGTYGTGFKIAPFGDGEILFSGGVIPQELAFVAQGFARWAARVGVTLSGEHEHGQQH